MPGLERVWRTGPWREESRTYVVVLPTRREFLVDGRQPTDGVSSHRQRILKIASSPSTGRSVRSRCTRPPASGSVATGGTARLRPWGRWPRGRRCRRAPGCGRGRRRGRRPASSSSWRPCSTMRPSSSTRIWSAPAMVDSRWAMTTAVRPASASARACCTSASFSESRWLVASSRIDDGRVLQQHRGRWPAAASRRPTGGSRARRRRCRSRRAAAMITSWIWAARHAVDRARRRWRRAGRSAGSRRPCRGTGAGPGETTPMAARSESRVRSRTSWPSTRDARPR